MIALRQAPFISVRHLLINGGWPAQFLIVVKDLTLSRFVLIHEGLVSDKAEDTSSAAV